MTTNDSDKQYKIVVDELLKLSLNTNKGYFGYLFSNNPFRKDTFKDNRFKKFMYKIHDGIREFIRKSTGYENVNVDTFIIENCIIAMGNQYGLLTENENIKKMPASMITNFNINDIIYDPEHPIYESVKEAVHYYLDKSDSMNKDWYSFTKQRLEDCIIDYFSQLICSKDDITLSNYFNYFPNETNLFYILVDCSNRVLHDIEAYFIRKYFDKLKETICEDVKTKTKDLIVKLQEENNTLKSKIKEDEKNKKFILPTLKQLQKDAEEGTEATKEMYKSAILERDREIRSLEKKYNKINDKYIKLKESLGEDVETEVDDIILDCDSNGKYVFVIHDDWTQVVDNLNKEFPNSKQIGDKDLSIDDDVQLVVFMVAYLSHRLYYRIKNYCQVHNIPYIHYSSTNMDRLKTEIAKKLTTE